MKFVSLPFDDSRCRPRPGPVAGCRVCARWADHPDQVWGERTPFDIVDPTGPHCDFIPADPKHR